MTEMLLAKLEEKMMLLLSEVERLRGEVGSLRQANRALVQEKDNNTNKLKDLLSLFDSISPAEDVAA
jgi:FtsZ-binding cell division protein ZapB